MSCPAKSYLTTTGEVYEGRSVFNHCQIVGEVACEIIQRMPSPIRKTLFPPGASLVAASHDIGKVSPTLLQQNNASLRR